MLSIGKSEKISDEMSLFASRLILCRSKGEIARLTGEFSALVEKVVEIESRSGGGVPSGADDKAISATIKFTKEECGEMSPDFRKLFIANERVARVIKRPSGKKTFLYEIRYRRNGYKIEVSSTDLHKAKRKFLTATKPENIDKYAVNVPKSGLNLFRELAAEWLEYKRGKVTAQTLFYYESCYRRYIRPACGDMPIKNIRTGDIDRILKGKSARVYENLRTVFNSIFKYAIASGIISHNPVMLVPFIKAERQPRRALTKEEQERLFERLKLPEFAEYRQAFTIMLYFGLRPCEVYTARFENGFLVARNAKRKNGKIEYKKIPIHKQAADKLAQAGSGDLNLGKEHRTEVLNRVFKRIMQDETVTQYYLRHTFATTCQMYVRPDIVDIWMGDSSERLVGRVYTHFSDKFMQEQMKKVAWGV